MVASADTPEQSADIVPGAIESFLRYKDLDATSNAPFCCLGQPESLVSSLDCAALGSVRYRSHRYSSRYHNCDAT